MLCYNQCKISKVNTFGADTVKCNLVHKIQALLRYNIRCIPSGLKQGLVMKHLFCDL